MVLPQPPGGPPPQDVGSLAKSGDVKVLMLDALRGMMQAAQEQGIDFDSLLQEARSSAPAKKQPVQAPPVASAQLPLPSL